MHWQHHCNLLPLFISVTATEGRSERVCGGGGLGIIEYREMGQEVERDQNRKRDRIERKDEETRLRGGYYAKKKKRTNRLKRTETEESSLWDSGTAEISRNNTTSPVAMTTAST